MLANLSGIPQHRAVYAQHSKAILFAPRSAQYERARKKPMSYQSSMGVGRVLPLITAGLVALVAVAQAADVLESSTKTSALANGEALIRKLYPDESDAFFHDKLLAAWRGILDEHPNATKPVVVSIFSIGMSPPERSFVLARLGKAATTSEEPIPELKHASDGTVIRRTFHWYGTFGVAFAGDEPKTVVLAIAYDPSRNRPVIAVGDRGAQTAPSNPAAPQHIRANLSGSWMSQGHYFAFDSNSNVLDEGLLLGDSRGAGYISMGSNTYTLEYVQGKPTITLQRDGRIFTVEELTTNHLRLTSKNQISGNPEDIRFDLLSRAPKSGAQQFNTKPSN